MYKDVPVERPIERVVEVVKEGKTIFMALLPASLRGGECIAGLSANHGDLALQ